MGGNGLHRFTYRTHIRVGCMDAADLLGLTTADLLGEAARLRDRTTGTRVTYSPKVFIPLTMLCRDRCGYCTFAKAPARLDSPYLPPAAVPGIAPAGAEPGRRRRRSP